MRRILIELERIGENDYTHMQYAEQLGGAIAIIAGEADVYAAHIKICKTPDGLRHTRVAIVSTYVKTLEHEKAVIELIKDKRAEWMLFEIRFNVIDET